MYYMLKRVLQLTIVVHASSHTSIFFKLKFHSYVTCISVNVTAPGTPGLTSKKVCGCPLMDKSYPANPDLTKPIKHETEHQAKDTICWDQGTVTQTDPSQCVSSSKTWLR